MIDLYATNNPIWASLTLSFICAQYVAAWLGVLFYLRAAVGPSSMPYRLFFLLGMPLGALILDVLMFLEPFGLLFLVPSAQLRYLLPAYRATRSLIEVTLEGLPQSVLQAYIFFRLTFGGGSDAQLGEDSLELVSFELLQRSLLISLVGFLKAWAEAWLGSRSRGITSREYLTLQLKMGAGLPIDALNRNAISEWTCGFQLTADQVEQLCTALRRNTSLHTLDLRGAGMGADDNPTGQHAAMIAASIRDKRSLRLVNLDGYPLLVGQLTGAEPVEQLDFSGKELQLASAVVIGACLGTNSSLRTFVLTRNSFSFKAAGEAIAKGIATCRKLPDSALTSVNISSSGVGREAATRILRTMSGTDVQVLGVAKCGLGDGDGALLGECIKSSKSLATLDLASNKLGPSGVKPIADALKVAIRSLQTLNLSGNKLGPVGTSTLASSS